MSDLYLALQADRLINKPQLVTPQRAYGVITGFGRRLGISHLIDADGGIIEINSIPEPQTRSVGAPSRGDSGRLFAIDEATGIAYIPVEGSLVHRFGFLDPVSGMTGYDAIKAKFGAAIEDPNVRGILMDYNTPGGEGHGCHGAAELIWNNRDKKPIWALVNEEANSGGYWLASAAHNVIVTVTSRVGSIGAVVVHHNIFEHLKKEGIAVTLITAGDHKVDGHPFGPLPDDVEADWKADLTWLQKLFAESVARNRNMTVEAVLATQARVFRGQEAVDLGLADHVMLEHEVSKKFAALLARAEGAASRQTA